MMMTIFVDSSRCPNTGAGGFGAWVKKTGWDRGHTFGDKLRRRTSDSTDAELQGIKQALMFLKHHKEFEGVTFISLQCDSLYALHSLIKYGGFKPAATKEKGDADVFRDVAHAHVKFRVIAEEIRDIVANVGLITVRHIKGHREGISTRSSVNEVCDAIAKGHMRSARAEAYARNGMGDKGVRTPDKSGRVADQA